MVNGFSKFNGEKKCAGTTDYPHTKKDPTTSLYTKIKSKWSKGLNIGDKSVS